jgi:hypothetical protein
MASRPTGSTWPRRAPSGCGHESGDRGYQATVRSFQPAEFASPRSRRHAVANTIATTSLVLDGELRDPVATVRRAATSLQVLSSVPVEAW